MSADRIPSFSEHDWQDVERLLRAAQRQRSLFIAAGLKHAARCLGRSPQAAGVPAAS